MIVNLSQHSYPLLIEENALTSLGEKIKTLYKNDKIGLVTDSNVDQLYGDKVCQTLERAGFVVHKVVFPAGEESKTPETLLSICGQLVEKGINRGHLIIALGGGVVGDMTGFAASILLRGIPYVQIPTTLLAQVDSSIGGKVAVDLPQGKNLLGSFYHPKLVVIDPLMLSTLSKDLLADGLAEVIKYGAILDADFFDFLATQINFKNFSQHAGTIIKRCCELKKQVVEQDERDTGLRMILNFGHTIGHAIEKCYNYQTYSHGQAVSMGMVAAAQLGEQLDITPSGTATRIKACCEKFDLPVQLPSLSLDTMLTAIAGDKKNIGKNLNFILLKQMGQAEIHPLEVSQIEDFLGGKV